MLSALLLHKVHRVLKSQADRGYAYPAQKSKQNRLASAFNQLYHICIHSYCRHSHNNKEFAYFLKRLKKALGRAQTYRNGSDYRSRHKKEDKEGKNLFNAYFAGSAVFGLLRSEQSERNSNRDNRERSRHLYRNGLVKGCRAHGKTFRPRLRRRR